MYKRIKYIFLEKMENTALWKVKLRKKISCFFRTTKLIVLIFIFPIILSSFKVKEKEFFFLILWFFYHFRTLLDYSSELRAAITLTQIQNAPTPKRIAKTKSISQDDALRVGDVQLILVYILLPSSIDIFYSSSHPCRKIAWQTSLIKFQMRA
jgi:hypothetical protein